MNTIDMKESSVDKIVNYLHTWFLMSFPQCDPIPSDFYCGITNDIDVRIAIHQSQGHNGKEITIKIAIKCASEAVASDVEDIMGKMGFDVGNPPHKANGAVPDSYIVYLYKKSQ